MEELIHPSTFKHHSHSLNLPCPPSSPGPMIRIWFVYFTWEVIQCLSEELEQNERRGEKPTESTLKNRLLQWATGSQIMLENCMKNTPDSSWKERKAGALPYQLLSPVDWGLSWAAWTFLQLLVASAYTCASSHGTRESSRVREPQTVELGLVLRINWRSTWMWV